MDLLAARILVHVEKLPSGRAGTRLGLDGKNSSLTIDGMPATTDEAVGRERQLGDLRNCDCVETLRNERLFHSGAAPGWRYCEVHGSSVLSLFRFGGLLVWLPGAFPAADRNNKIAVS